MRSLKPVQIQVLAGVLVTLLSFLWFFFPGRYVLLARQDLSLFLLDADYLLPYLKEPGGILVYCGIFLEQLLRFPLGGALLLSAMVSSLFFLSLRLLYRVPDPVVRVAVAILVAATVVAMHHYPPHRVHHTLGCIIVLVLADRLPLGGRGMRTFLLLTVPLLYYICGGYLWFFLLLRITLTLGGMHKPGREWLFWTLAFPVLVFLAGALVFLKPIPDQALQALPLGPGYGFSPWVLIFAVLIPALPLLGKWSIGRKQFSYRRIIPLSLLTLACSFLLIHFSYNRKRAEFYNLESYALKKDWPGLIRYAEQHPSSNLFGIFYTNLALLQEGRLCTDLFRFPQPFGERSLFFGWEARGEVLRRGGDFYWAIGFVNEAHHWAFESMIENGLTFRSLDMLIKAELVRGNFRVAEKYIGWMEQSLFDRRLARHYRSLLKDPRALAEDPELGSRAAICITQDFFADGTRLEYNLKAMLQNAPASRPVMDYLMALYLLENRTDQIVELLPAYRQCCQGPLPVLLEESLLVHRITYRENTLPEIQVSEQTLRRFNDYIRLLRNSRNREEAGKNLYPGFGDTFWFYHNFTSQQNS